MQQVNTAEENVIDDNYRTYYEVFVYSFYDSDGDGIGDLKGLTENLDYINDGDPETDTDLGWQWYLADAGHAVHDVSQV